MPFRVSKVFLAHVAGNTSNDLFKKDKNLPKPVSISLEELEHIGGGTAEMLQARVGPPVLTGEWRPDTAIKTG
jgi:hypothetical protein